MKLTMDLGYTYEPSYISWLDGYPPYNLIFHPKDEGPDSSHRLYVKDSTIVYKTGIFYKHIDFSKDRTLQRLKKDPLDFVKKGREARFGHYKKSGVTPTIIRYNAITGYPGSCHLHFTGDDSILIYHAYNNVGGNILYIDPDFSEWYSGDKDFFLNLYKEFSLKQSL